MKTRLLLPVCFLCALVASAGLVTPPWAFAKRGFEPTATKELPPIRKWAYKYLETAYAALDQEHYDEAANALDELAEKDRRLNDHERTVLWQTRAYVYSAKEDYPKALKAFETCLGIGVLPDASLQNVRYNLGQLYMVTGRFDDAIETFETWFAAEPSPTATAHFMLAMAYLQDEQADKALVHAREAVAKDTDPREPHLQLLASLLIDQQQYAEAAPVMETLVATFPKKVYFTQLSAMYSELGKPKRALGTLEIAYVQHLLDESRDLTTLAQLYLFNQVPYKAAKVIEQGIADGVIGEKDAAAWELLGNSWLQAKERTRAMDPLVQAASLGATGDGYVQLGRVQLAEGQWTQARDSMHAALRKGGLKEPASAQLLLGIANMNDARWDEARTAFEAAAADPQTRPLAEQWLSSIEREMQAEQSDRPNQPDAPAADGVASDSRTDPRSASRSGDAEPRT